jgi:hypothetical protein
MSHDMPLYKFADVEGRLDQEIKDLETAEVPEIDIEMAIQRKYPEAEHLIVPHDGKKTSQIDVVPSRTEPMLTGAHYDARTQTAMASFAIQDFEIGLRWLLSADARPHWMLNHKEVNEDTIASLFKSVPDAKQVPAILTMAAVNALTRFDGFRQALQENLSGGPKSTAWTPTVLQAKRLNEMSCIAFNKFYQRSP